MEEHGEYRGTVEDGWGLAEDIDAWKNWTSKVASCTTHLNKWQATTFRNAATEIGRLKQKLQVALNKPSGLVDCNFIKSLREKIDCLWKQEEIY